MQERWGKLSEDWMNISEIIIYGFGLVAEVVFDQICSDIDVKFVIDNKLGINGTKYNGIPVYSYEDCKHMIGKIKIVIAADTVSAAEIVESLKEDDYYEDRDFTTIERFVTEWYYRRFHKANLLEMHTSITTRCTFNCRYCNIFMPYYKERIDYTFEEFKKNVDMLFHHIDYVFKYQLIGGEPFLNKDLSQMIRYLYEKYDERIGMIRIITNGGIVPDDELVDAMKTCKCDVLLSNYTHSIPYKEKYEKVKSTLLDNGIKYGELISQRWRDVGFPHNPRNIPLNKVREHMLTCATFWHGLVDEKLYYCNCTWSAANTGLYNIEKTDYLDLKTLDDSENGKIQILQFVLGDSQPGYYNSFCRVCGGCGKDNDCVVASGEQLK